MIIAFYYFLIMESEMGQWLKGIIREMNDMYKRKNTNYLIKSVDMLFHWIIMSAAVEYWAGNVLSNII